MISLEKTYRTKYRHEVRLFVLNKQFVKGVLGAFKRNSSGKWVLNYWDLDGRSSDGSSYWDLVEVKEND